MGSIDEAWRRIVEGENHRILASLSYGLVLEVVKWAAKAGMLDQRLAKQANYEIALIDKSDLSDTAKLLYKTFTVLDPRQEHRQFQMRLSTIRHKATRQLIDNCPNPQERRQLVRASRINDELQRLFEILAMVRNVDAHQKQSVDDLGWCMMIAGVALRITELAPVKPGDEEKLSSLRTAIFDIIKSLFMEDPTGDFQPIKDLVAQREGLRIEKKPDLEVENNGVDAKIADAISGIKGEIFSISETLRELSKNAEDEDEDEDVEVLSEPALVSNQQTYTIEQARQQLLKIKQKISDDQESEGAPLSPAQHILQRPIIEATLAARPRSLDEWKNLPDIGWRLLKHNDVMSKQLKRWGNQIAEVLGRLERAHANAPDTDD